MLKEKPRSEYGHQARRKQTIHTVLLIVLALVLCGSAGVVIVGWRSRLGTEKKELLRLWDEGTYDTAFELSRTGLENKPTDYFLLTLHGFASYQLAIAQINSFDTLTYIDECIWSLRKALMTKNGVNDGRVQYVLGKAYYYKGSGYAELAIQFLEEARELSYTARDIPEYLGLSYAAIQDYRSSVEAFSQALDPGEGESDYPSDLLLLAIARSYIALEELETAKAYLVRCIEISRDSNTVITARLLLGDIMLKAGNPDEAEAQYMAILEDDGENAEAHFQLGELYIAGGDGTRARAEWRRALRIDSTHARARSRLNL
ncbi:putative TPR domain protein [Treponema primitia ZAS-2]|uniref:Putative TPR domain protein n=1 Tax=Treponema primitia (strain ATCC BAA-887 / DSM 12427 / ZAS-2) TaxID=545694 RepID=F5YHY2_TREPZ|nr:tetratricopeptide repeat protein [Treponema primitia]AEF83692.1 putative TPR domain protein [Treponema primitia ZAS-2]